MTCGGVDNNHIFHRVC